MTAMSCLNIVFNRLDKLTTRFGVRCSAASTSDAVALAVLYGRVSWKPKAQRSRVMNEDDGRGRRTMDEGEGRWTRAKDDGRWTVDGNSVFLATN